MKRKPYSEIKNLFNIQQFQFKQKDKYDFYSPALKTNLWFACMALIQAPYNCKPSFRRSLADYQMFIDFIDYKGQKCTYLIMNLQSPLDVYYKFCRAIGLED